MADLGKIAVTPRGEYNASKIYEILDLVTDSGNSYISKLNDNDKPLTDYLAWQLSAKKGDPGKQGSKGDTGFKTIDPIFVKPEDLAPTTNGTFKPIVISEDNINIDPLDYGTLYPNHGNLRAKEGYDTLFNFEDGVWKKSETKLAEAKTYIMPLENSTFPLLGSDSNPIQRTYENSIWQLIEGKTATATDVPSDTSTVWKSIGSSGVSLTFDPNSETKAQGGKQIATWLGIGNITKLIGSNLVGGLSSSAAGSPNGSLLSNLSCKATESMTIKSVVTNFTVAGDFKIAITDVNNAVIWTSAETYTAGAGWVKNTIPAKVLEAGQTIWLSLLSSAFSIRFSETGAPSSEKFIQRALSGGIASGDAGSYYSVYFNGETDNYKGILSDYISKADAEGYTNVDPLESFGSSAFNTAIGNQPATGLYILKIPFTVAKTVQKIFFTSEGAGSMKFVIGTLDQANKFIQDREISLNVVAGLNNITVDWELKTGQYVGVKTPGLMPNINTSLANNYLWAVEGSYTGVLSIGTAWSLGLSLDVRTRIYSTDALAHMSDIYTLEEKIENIQTPNIYTSPDGNKWRLGVSNAGTSVWTVIGKYTKILHFGNSMLLHSIQPYWWGYWGMAAKTRQDDYAHRFLAKIKVASPTAQSWEENIATWEQNPSGFNKASLDPLLAAQTYDLVIVRLGENATSVPSATYKNEFRNLITYIQNKVPTARIIIGGMFWANSALDAAMLDIANEKGLTYASMSGLDIPANKSFVGDVVQGDDGQSHTVDNAGVANHPNNAGMEEIAKRLFTAANS